MNVSKFLLSSRSLWDPELPLNSPSNSPRVSLGILCVLFFSATHVAVTVSNTADSIIMVFEQLFKT